MQKADTLGNQSKKIIALMLVFFVVITPISVYAQINPITIPATSTTTNNAYNNYYNNFAYTQNQISNANYYGNSQDLGEAIILNVVDYEPKVIKSSQIEAADVPVYAYLQGSTIGSLMGVNSPQSEPFISSPKIRSITITPSGGSSNFVRGTLYQPPNYGSLDLNNMGYVVVTLRQISDEKKVPKEIVLNMSAKIYFDFLRGYGDISSVDMVLKESGAADDWKTNADSSSFWNKKGFLRLTSVQGNVAKIQLYDSSLSLVSLITSQQDMNTPLQNYNEQGLLMMGIGETRSFSIPGSSAFFHDQGRIVVNGISDPKDEAELRVVSSDGTSYRKVTEGMRIAPGSNWQVYKINTGNICDTYNNPPNPQGCTSASAQGCKWDSINNKCILTIQPASTGVPSVATPATTQATTWVSVDAILSNQKSKLSKESIPLFINKVYNIADNLRTNPNYLIAIMGFETGGTFDPAIINRAGSGATGLIQFMPSTAASLGTTTADLLKMDAITQLDYVEMYLKTYKGRMSTLEDAYMAVLWPAAIGKSTDYPIFTAGVTNSRAYELNSGLDKNKDGIVTVEEATQRVRYYYIPSSPSLIAGQAVTGFATQQPATTSTSNGIGSVILTNTIGEKKILYLTYSSLRGTNIDITDQNVKDRETPLCSGVITSSNPSPTSPKELLCKAISEYESAMSADTGRNDQIYEGLSDAYLTFADKVTTANENKIVARAVALYYLKKISAAGRVENKILELEKQVNGGTSSVSEYLEDEGISVSLTDIIPPDLSQKSYAEIIGGESTTGIKYYESDPLVSGTDPAANNQHYDWRITSINDQSVTVQRMLNGIPGQQAVLTRGGNNQFLDGKPVILKNIQTNKRVYVTITPGAGNVYSDSSFYIHIPIEAREIQWTPEQIDKMIEETTKQIKTLENYIEQLDNLVVSWRYICFATFAYLTIKNSFLGGAANRNMARKDIIPAYNEKCRNEELNSNYGETFDQCINKNAADIEANLDEGENVVKAAHECSGMSDQVAMEDCYSNNGIIKDKNLYPNSFNKYGDTLKDLKIQDPVDSTKWDQMITACTYASDTKMTKDFQEAQAKNCNNLQDEINGTTNAFDATFDSDKVKEDIKNYNKETDQQKKDILKQTLAADYSLFYEASLNNQNNQKFIDANQDSIKKKILEVYNKDVQIIPISYSSPDKNTFNFISSDLKLESSPSLVPVTLRDSTQDATGWKAKEAEACKIFDSPACKSAQVALDQPQTISIGGRDMRLFKKADGTYYAALDTVELTQEGQRATYAPNAKVEIDKDGKPYCLPVGNGNYVKVLSWYAKGDPDDCELWNVGADGLLCSGDDKLLVYKNIMGNDPRTKSGICTNAATQFQRQGKCKDGQNIKLNNQNFLCSSDSYKLAQMGMQQQCIDVMDPSDCKKWFAVCDPVMCPASRFNLGEKWPVTDVAQTGIIGSLILGLPNFPEDPVPVCLPGILAGLKNIKSLLDGFNSCLNAAKVNHQNIGICDKIRSVGICELLWREAINIFKARGSIMQLITEKISGDKTSGGGEFLSGFNAGVNSVSDSVKYFTNQYATSAFAAYKGRSTAEIGTEVCQAAIYGKFSDVGDFVNQLAQPENPPQFFASFDESPWAVNAGKTFSTQYGMQSPEQSEYSVYYHIYAGTIPKFAQTGYAQNGLKFAVYLKDANGRTVFVTTSNANQIYDTVPYGGYKDITVERFAASGMTTICVNMNGQEKCGFGKVTTAFALNYLNDQLVKDEALKQSITTADKCVSDVPTVSPSLGGVILPREYGLISTGVVRTCSVLDPDSASGQNVDYWKDVGSCATDSQGNSLGKCWMDMRTVSVNDKSLNDYILINITLNQGALQAGINKLSDLFNADQSRYFLDQLDNKKKDILNTKGVTIKDDLINLITTGIQVPTTNSNTITVTYKMITQVSIDPDSRTRAHISIAEIYVLVAQTLSNVPISAIQSIGLTEGQPPCESLDIVTCLTKSDSCETVEGKCVTIMQSTQAPVSQTTQTAQAPAAQTQASIIKCEDCGLYCTEQKCNFLNDSTQNRDCYYKSGLVSISILGNIGASCISCPDKKCYQLSDNTLCGQCSQQCKWDPKLNVCTQK